MALEFFEEDDGRLLVIRASGKLVRDDYAHFGPEVDRLIDRYGRIRILFEMRDFHGWDAGALWEDIKFDLKHFKDIERLAIIGQKRWQKGMATFCKPFTKAKIRYFTPEQVQDAHQWLEQELSPT